jgi:hypothetical protein
VDMSAQPPMPSNTAKANALTASFRFVFIG